MTNGETSNSVKHAALPILSHKTGPGVERDRKRQLTRRQAIQALFSSVGAGFCLTALAAAHPARRHFENVVTLEQADAKVAAAEWKPEFLTATQNQTLVAIAERMLPGSTQAQVNRIIDLLLSVDTAINQRNFTASLSALDGDANHKYGKPFSLLAPQQRDELLTFFANGKQSHVNATSADPDEPEPEKNPVTLRDHFENLKGWIVAAYYSTEIGMRELGWTEDFYFEELPSCEHNGVHARDSAAVQDTASEQLSRLSRDGS